LSRAGPGRTAVSSFGGRRAGEVRTIGSTRRPGAGGSSPVLEVTELRTHLFTDEGVIRAVDGMSLRSRPSGRVGMRQWLPAGAADLCRNRVQHRRIERADLGAVHSVHGLALAPGGLGEASIGPRLRRRAAP